MKQFLILLLQVIHQTISKERVFKFQPRESGCGLSSCAQTRPGYTNVHLVPHSHDDTGWLKTVDEYYYGAKQEVQRAGVQYILESVVKELARDPAKKFIQVETGFFWRWWEDKDEFMRNITRQMVEAGQIEFTGGGWSMNDEATTHYASIIDNMEFGLNWLVDNLGPCAVPTIAWQIDPFGHTKEQARLFAEMGFEGLFFARIDYRDKIERKEKQSLQMWWEGGEEGEVDSTIFTGVFDNHYSNPAGFCWDILCTDEPINDDPLLEEFNLEQQLQAFQAYVTNHTKYYKDQEHIMFTMGDDFQYQNARMNFKNMDKLVHYMNLRTEETGMHLVYSTPSCYLESLRQGGQVYPYKSDDFLPYASGSTNYWTGYFTSRPAIKLQERLGARDLAVCRQVGLLQEPEREKEEYGAEFHMHRAMGLMQHHDAVTGTEKQAVAEDYSKRLYRASQACQDQNMGRISQISGVEGPYIDLTVTNCPAMNVSQCEISESSDKFLLSVYNPLSWPVSPYLRVPVPSPSYRVFTSYPVPHQLTVQVNQIPDYIRAIPGRESLSQYELIFRVDDVPGLGFTQLHVEKVEEEEVELTVSNMVRVGEVQEDGALVLPGNIKAELLYYEGWTEDGQPSGAYVFRPKAGGKHSLGEAVYSEVVGQLVNETVVQYGDWGVLSVRSYLGKEVQEVNWQVGPIPGGKEVVVVYSTDLQTEGKFYTDSNGRQTIERTRNTENKEMESSNYYPVTNRMELRTGEGEVMTVVTDRSQGGSSLEDGQLELMVHRRCLKDDWYGVGEALKEEAFGVGLVARGQHSILRGDMEELSRARRLAQEKVLPPQLSLVATSLNLAQWLDTPGQKIYSALDRSLPSQVQLLTLSPWKTQDQVLVRLQHILDLQEGGADQSLDLTALFTQFSVVSMQETTLAANQPAKTTNRQQWESKMVHSDQTLEDLVVTLRPMQIRTFVLSVSWL